MLLKSCILLIFWSLPGLGFKFFQSFWTMVGLGLSFKY